MREGEGQKVKRERGLRNTLVCLFVSAHFSSSGNRRMKFKALQGLSLIVHSSNDSECNESEGEIKGR